MNHARYCQIVLERHSSCAFSASLCLTFLLKTLPHSLVPTALSGLIAPLHDLHLVIFYCKDERAFPSVASTFIIITNPFASQTPSISPPHLWALLTSHRLPLPDHYRDVRFCHTWYQFLCHAAGLPSRRHLSPCYTCLHHPKPVLNYLPETVLRTLLNPYISPGTPNVHRTRIESHKMKHSL